MGETMRRREFIGLIGGLAAAWPYSAISQTPDRASKVGLLVGLRANDPEWIRRFAALKKGLQELGWEEGRNLVFETRYTVGGPDQLSSAAADLVSTKANVLVTG